jgi:integrase
VFYQAIWSLYDKNGKRKRQTKAFARQSDAKAHAAKMEAECERRGVGDVNKQTFASFKERVLNFWETRGKLSETSLIGYRRNLDALAREIGHIQLSKLSALHIDEALAALKTSGGASRKPPREGAQRDTRPLADRTLLHIYRIGSTSMQQAVRWKLVSTNPFKEVDAPKPAKKKIKIMTEAEAIKVYRCAVLASETGKHPGMDLLVALLLTCGIRRSEVLGLAFDAINLDTGTINIFRTVVAGTKGEPILRDHRAKSEASIRTISLPAEIIPMVRRQRQWITEMMLRWGRQTYRADPLLLFPTFGGEPLPPGLLTIRLRQLQRQAKVTGVAPTHGFRHGMASQMVADGVDIRTIADRMGHATTSFTLSTYVHSIDGKDRAAADRLGEQFRSMKDQADKA